MSRVLAGPWPGQLLADYGADVIKIERPVSGDDTRHWGPPWLKDADGLDTQDAAYFFAANRNKRSDTRVEYRSAPPLLGQHTAEVLSRELAYSAKKIAALQAAGAI